MLLTSLPNTGSHLCQVRDCIDRVFRHLPQSLGQIPGNTCNSTTVTSFRILCHSVSPGCAHSVAEWPTNITKVRNHRYLNADQISKHKSCPHRELQCQQCLQFKIPPRNVTHSRWSTKGGTLGGRADESLFTTTGRWGPTVWRQAVTRHGPSQPTRQAGRVAVTESARPGESMIHD